LDVVRLEGQELQVADDVGLVVLAQAMRRVRIAAPRLCIVEEGEGEVVLVDDLAEVLRGVVVKVRPRP
jgi:hypothetical protein